MSKSVRPTMRPAAKVLVLGVYLFVQGLLLMHPQQSPSTETNTYVPNEVLVTLAESYLPAPEFVSLANMSVGYEPIDSLFVACDGVLLTKLIPSYNKYASDAGRRLERTFVLRYSANIDPADIAQVWSALPYFERVEVNYILDWEVHGTSRFVPGPGTAFPNQWYFDNTDLGDSSDIDIPEAWAIEEGNANLVIAIFDTGVKMDTSTAEYGWKLHSDFNYHWIAQEDVGSPGVINAADLDGIDSNSDQSGNHPYAYKSNIIGFCLLEGYDADESPGVESRKRFWYGVPHSWELDIINNCGCPIHDPDCPCPNSWEVVGYDQHGVWVASIAAAKLDYGKPDGPDIVGIAHNCKVYWGRFDGEQTSDDMASAIEHFSQVARIVNMSFGGPNQSDAVQDAVTVATQDNDCVLVSSTGNLATSVNYPARYDSVLAVGAVMRTPMALTGYSNWTSTAEIVDVVAPVGNGIEADSYSDCPGAYPCAIAEEFTENTDQGTSFASPQAAGVGALIRSRFPGLNQFDVKQRIKKGAQFYWNKSNPTDRRKYGAGKVNAYRSVSESGKITSSTTWTTNTLAPLQQGGTWVSRPGSRDGKYYVSGDLTIEPGATLTIAAGTVVRVAPDHEQAGTDPYRVQIVVKGTLNIAGTSTNPVIFEGFTDSAPTNNDWLGIQFETGSSGTISHAVIRNAKTAISSYVPLTVNNVTIEDGSLTGIHAFAGLTISNSTFRDILYPAIKIESGNLTATNVEVLDSSYGIVGGTGTGTISITNCDFHDLDYGGIEFQNQMGPLTISQTTVEDCLDGIRIGNHSSGTIDACTIRRNDIGIWTSNSTGFLIKHCEIDSNTTNGIYSVLSQATVETDTVTHSAVGVSFATYSGGSVLGGTLIANNTGVGVKCDNTSIPTIRHTRITANANGVTALNNSAPNLGVAASGEECDASGPNIGNNSIYGNTTYNVSNLSTGLTIAAEGNWWNADPPHASKFYGLVSREPYLCDNPNPVSPWDGTDPGPEDKPGSTLPTRYSLGASHPNPFNPVTTMTFDVPAPGGEVEIAIFDVKGAKVQTLAHGRHDAGIHTATWTGRSDSGEPVASGVYFVRMTAPSFTQTRKVVLLK